jgi:hypothetical protein
MIMSFVGDKVDIEVQGQVVPVVGGGFTEMKDFIKETFPGRRYADLVWHLPQSLDEVRPKIEGKGWQLLVTEDDQLDKELEQIEKLQQWVIWFAEEIRYRAELAAEAYRGYSFNSKSREKARLGSEAGCFSYALDYARMAAEELTEPQIATLKASVNRIREYGAVPIKEWLKRFSIDASVCDWDKACKPHVLPLGCVALAEVPTKEFPVIGKQYLWDVYILELSEEWGIHPGLIPRVEGQERIDPDGDVQKVLVLQVGQPGDER